MDRQIKTASGLTLLFGLWLIVSPFVLSFAGSTGMWDAIVVGVIALVLSWIRYANPPSTSALSWLVALLGVWLILSPYVFAMSGVASLLWAYFVTGAAFIVFGAWAALARPAASM